jgi:RimJ/RimL family protein N-acetyltransferase
MPFRLQPVLSGALLELRPLAAEHIEALYAAAADPLIWEQHPQKDRWKREVFALFIESAFASKGAFAVFERSSGELAGSSRYYDLDEAKSEVAIGFTFLIRRLWGGRHNTELKALMLGHAFSSLERVKFHVGQDNKRSRRAVEKLGAALTGLKPGDPKSVEYTLERGVYLPRGR